MGRARLRLRRRGAVARVEPPPREAPAAQTQPPPRPAGAGGARGRHSRRADRLSHQLVSADSRSAGAAHSGSRAAGRAARAGRTTQSRDLDRCRPDHGWPRSTRPRRSGRLSRVMARRRRRPRRSPSDRRRRSPSNQPSPEAGRFRQRVLMEWLARLLLRSHDMGPVGPRALHRRVRRRLHRSCPGVPSDGCGGRDLRSVARHADRLHRHGARVVCRVRPGVRRWRAHAWDGGSIATAGWRRSEAPSSATRSG